jgi:aliphatic nitrilase
VAAIRQLLGLKEITLCTPITEGEGIAIADLDFSLITKRKRMMDSVGHYSRPDLLQLRVNLDAQTVMEVADGIQATDETD